MTNVFTREELLLLLKKHRGDFKRGLSKRIESRNWRVSPEYRSVSSINGKICVNVGSLEAVQQMTAEAAVDGAMILIDILSNSSVEGKSSKELETIKTRLVRLENELYKILPPDFTNPSAENPSNN